MGYDSNNNTNNNTVSNDTQYTPLVNTMMYQPPNYLNGPASNEAFSMAPNMYIAPQPNQINNNNNNNENSNTNNNNNQYNGYPGQFAQPPPGYYQAYVPAAAIITTTTVEDAPAHGSRSYFHAEEVTGALIIFLCGFFLSCIWLAGCIYFRSKNSTARALGILSVVLFILSFILAIIIISIIVATPNQTYN
ncbi:hypothetical protein SAMD00019534_093220 [Acytostelium subglobosum LB1]|uniref:hypothetical protein n=1 Tax=Acytostelium subglobosum LB1 TaxID=1410327 RepID=UPI00064485F0|nr:hypothetical protein SAMD00019534_093220 [Acytostelium subglobosum LB1]GAM26147.1 hypothetical protein SAMD00019534_093220 [Acytostelium subglobosum LB1]|eukprot:XP_012750701.1 hypothetical protein SAMD00019534_093220 [Acytostelium subglobosum LB1]